MLNRIKKHIFGLDLHMKEVVSGAFISLVFRILGAVAQFGFSVLVARWFGAKGFGVYALALSIVLIASAFGRWGLDVAALKFISVYKDKNEGEKIKKIFNKSAILILAISIVVSVLLFLQAPWLSTFFSNESQLMDLLTIMILSILPFSLLNLLAESLRAINKIGAFVLTQGLLVPVISVALLILFHILGSGLIGAAHSFVISTCIVFLIASFLWKRNSNFEYNASGTDNSGVSFGGLLKTASPMAWVGIASVGMSINETLILGVFHSAEEVGIYAAALRLSLLLNFIIIAFDSTLAPKFAALGHGNSLSKIPFLVRSSALLMFLLASPLLLLFIIFPGFALQVFSPEFTTGANALIILTLGQVINIGVGPVRLLLLMTGHENILKYLVLFSLLTSFVSGLLLIPFFGVVGAACSASLATITLNIMAAWTAKKRLGTKMFAFKTSAL